MLDVEQCLQIRHELEELLKYYEQNIGHKLPIVYKNIENICLQASGYASLWSWMLRDIKRIGE